MMFGYSKGDAFLQNSEDFNRQFFSNENSGGSWSGSEIFNSHGELSLKTNDNRRLPLNGSWSGSEILNSHGELSLRTNDNRRLPLKTSDGSSSVFPNGSHLGSMDYKLQSSQSNISFSIQEPKKDHNPRTMLEDREIPNSSRQDVDVQPSVNDDGSKHKERASTSTPKVRQPRFSFQTRSEIDVLEDGYRWRKYGQKSVKNNTHPRSYYRCTHQSCKVKKQIQRHCKDEGIVVTTYEGTHNHQCEKPVDNFECILRQMHLHPPTNLYNTIKN